MVERNLTSQLVAQIQPLAGKGARGIVAKKKLGIACPVCGAELVTTPFGYGCSNYKKDGTGCGFSIGTIAGRDLSEEEFRDLITKGRTDVLDGFVSKSKKKFPAALVLQKDEEGKINISFDFSANEPQVVEGIKCPSCGGDIVTTAYGFRCIHYDREKEDSCDFSVGKIAEKSLNVSQLTELVTNGRTGTIRGFKSKNGKRFDACLCLEKDENGKAVIKFDFEHVEAKKVKDVVCPLCGGEIVQTPFGFGCANYSKDNPESCKFAIGTIAGVKLKEAQVKELLLRGKTEVIKGFIAKTGMMFDAPLKLTPEGQVTFDFPEKPKPVDTTLKCPKCGQYMKKSQWYYECECGFKVAHTVAKVELEEAIMQELFETGKTKKKITGFTSKAGNVFDTCLKFEDDRISFDFDNPGENVVLENAKPAESAQNQEKQTMFEA